MSYPDLLWAAGFYEGEGSTYPIKHRSGNASTPAVVVWSSDKDAVERFGAALGAGYLNGPYKRGGDKPMYTWRITKRVDSITALEVLRPHVMSRRQAQIDRVLEACA